MFRIERGGRRWLLVVLSGALMATTVPARPVVAQAVSRAKEKEASIVAKQALGFYLKKKFGLAAELYRRVAEIDPSKPDYHYAVGRCEQQAGKLAQARAAFERVLAMGKPGGTFVMKAKAQLEAVRKAEVKQAEVARREAEARERQRQIDADAKARAAAVEAERRAAEAPKTAAPSEGTPSMPAPIPSEAGSDAGSDAPSGTGTSEGADGAAAAELRGAAQAEAGSHRWVAWSVAGIGGAALVTGGALLLVALGDQDALDANKTDKGKFDGAKIDLATARARQTAINDKITGGWIAFGAGTAIAAAGCYLLLRPDAPRAVLLPRRDGMTLALRF